MSLDERLRQDLGRLSADLTTEPINIEADLQGVMVAGRRRRVLRKVSRGVAVATLLLLALFVVPGVLRSLGFLEITTNLPADNPPTESQRNDGLGITGGQSEKGSQESRGAGGVGGVGTSGSEGGVSQGGSSAGTRPRGTTSNGSVGTSGPKAATPNRPGTYPYDVSGTVCSTFQGYRSCYSVERFEITYEQSSGSHQRRFHRFRHSRGGSFDAEYSHDYRPDGVYWEHFSGTFVNPWGVPGAFACPELDAAPIQVWFTGAQPGDRWESTSSCNDFSPGESESGDRSTFEIIRAETISIGGREVATFFVRAESYRGSKRNMVIEGWHEPDHFLFVKGDVKWSDDGGSGDFWAERKSMDPS